MNLENELSRLRKTIESRNKVINGLLELNDGLIKENAELSRQIKLFIDAENWGRDAVKYEGEYK